MCSAVDNCFNSFLGATSVSCYCTHTCMRANTYTRSRVPKRMHAYKHLHVYCTHAGILCLFASSSASKLRFPISTQRLCHILPVGQSPSLYPGVKQQQTQQQHTYTRKYQLLLTCLQNVLTLLIEITVLSPNVLLDIMFYKLFWGRRTTPTGLFV